MLPLDRPLLDDIASGAAAAAVLALLSSVFAHARISRVRRDVAAIDGSGKESVIGAVRRTAEQAGAMRSELDSLQAQIEATRREMTDALRHVAVVRYDAFGDMGGRLSFSVALLDEAGDGVVVTSIHGRSEARTYAKGITAGTSELSLSPEEKQTIELAMRGPAGR